MTETLTSRASSPTGMLDPVSSLHVAFARRYLGFDSSCDGWPLVISGHYDVMTLCRWYDFKDFGLRDSWRRHDSAYDG